MVTIIGGGLAGCEAAWQVASRGLPVRLHEMRPVRPTLVHQGDHLAELVCSNSFRGDKLDNAVGVLKEEMRRLGSLILQCADATRVPAGAALAVDRGRFAAAVTAAISAHPLIDVVRGEVTAIPDAGAGGGPVIVATGPLTSDALSQDIARFVGAEHLAFYDAISPIVLAESIDRSIVFRASRWGRSLRGGPAGSDPGPEADPAPPGEGTPDPRPSAAAPSQGPACGVDDGEGDYLNCPMDEAEYRAFYDALVSAESATVHDFDKAQFFEGCLPIEVMAHRGRDTLRFGPMKPVGLPRPAYGPHSVRGGAVAAGHAGGRPLQPGRVPDPDQMGRPGPRAADDSRPAGSRVRPLRDGAPQHVHQRPDRAAADLADPQQARPFLRWSDFRCRGVRGVGGVGPARRDQRRPAGPRQRAPRGAARDRHRRPGVLRLARRRQALPAEQHHFRDHAAPRRTAGAAAPCGWRAEPQGAAQGRAGAARAAGTGRLAGRHWRPGPPRDTGAARPAWSRHGGPAGSRSRRHVAAARGHPRLPRSPRAQPQRLRAHRPQLRGGPGAVPVLPRRLHGHPASRADPGARLGRCDSRIPRRAACPRQQPRLGGAANLGDPQLCPLPSPRRPDRRRPGRSGRQPAARAARAAGPDRGRSHRPASRHPTRPPHSADATGPSSSCSTPRGCGCPNWCRWMWKTSTCPPAWCG